MNATPGLFDSLRNVGLARRNAHGTSKLAARAISPELTRLRLAVLEHIGKQGILGSTDEEGETALGIKPQTYTPRRGELVTAGLVVATRNRRDTSSGRTAIVWVLREYAGASDRLTQKSPVATSRLRPEEPPAAGGHPVTCVPSSPPAASNGAPPTGCSQPPWLTDGLSPLDA